jgi:hypothetical protein
MLATVQRCPDLVLVDTVQNGSVRPTSMAYAALTRVQ